MSMNNPNLTTNFGSPNNTNSGAVNGSSDESSSVGVRAGTIVSDSAFTPTNSQSATMAPNGSGMQLPSLLPVVSGTTTGQPSTSSVEQQLPISPQQNLEKQMLELKQIFDRKQQDLLLHFQQAQANLAVQQMAYYRQLQERYQTAAANAAAAATAAAQQNAAGPRVAPLMSDSSQASSSLNDSTDTIAQQGGSQSDLNSPVFHPSSLRGKRTLSGGSGTITQETKDRLKQVLQAKQQLKNTRAAAAGGAPTIAVSPPHASHFAPYPLKVAHSIAQQPDELMRLDEMAAEYQLRKVNSEPNLKMRNRLRQKLLSKAGVDMTAVSAAAVSYAPLRVPYNSAVQSPLQARRQGAFQQLFQSAAVAGQTTFHRSLERDGDDHTMDTTPPLVEAIHSKAAVQQIPVRQQLIAVPSPSLPNLPNQFGDMVTNRNTIAAMSQGQQPSAANNGGLPFPLVFPGMMSSMSSSAVHQSGGGAATNFFNCLPNLLPPQTADLSALSLALNQQRAYMQALQEAFVGSVQLPVVAAPASLTDGDGAARNGRRNFTFDGGASAGGSTQQSLLKQQLRDLIMRRKSLVREETEDEISSVQQALARNKRMDGGVLQQGRSQSDLRTGIAFDSQMSKHICLCGDNKNHVEHGGRVQSIWARLVESGLVDRCERVPGRKASLDHLRLCHSDTYVTFFAVSPTACLKLDPAQLPLKSFVQLPCGGIGVDADTYFNDASTQLAARLAVGTLTELCIQVLEGKLKNGFAVIRPPGHHSEYEQAMGFCYFNNVALATRFVQQRLPHQISPKRIAIIDWDVHHGNGTQLQFESDNTVLYLSLHRYDDGKFFPGTGDVIEIGKDAGKGYTINIPFSGCEMGDSEYLAAWRVVVHPILTEFNPDFILVSAGFDGARGHPPALGGYSLTPSLFGFLTGQLMKLAGGKVVLALEGGYELAAISDAAQECVQVLCSGGENGGRLSQHTMNTVPNLSAQDTIQKVVAVHKKHWRTLTGDQGLGMSEAEWENFQKRFASLSVEQNS